MRNRFPNAHNTKSESENRKTVAYGKPRLKHRAITYGPRYVAAQWFRAYGYWPSKRRLRREFARLKRERKSAILRLDGLLGIR